MNTNGNIAILIMAAGESSRMKGIKQLLPWEGTTLLLHTLNTLLAVQKEAIYMVLGANADVIQTNLNLSEEPITLIKNKNWKNGLGSSIACGIEFILNLDGTYDGILICLADQPLLSSLYYQEMIDVFNANSAAIVATKYPKKSGVPAIFNTETARELIHLKEDYGARHLMTQYKDNSIILSAGENILDIDTMETYNLVYKQHNLTQE